MQSAIEDQLARIRRIKAQQNLHVEQYNAEVAKNLAEETQRKQQEKKEKKDEIEQKCSISRSYSLDLAIEHTLAASRKFKDGRSTKALERALQTHTAQKKKLDRVLAEENITTYAEKFNKPCCQQWKYTDSNRKTKCIDFDTTDIVRACRQLYHNSKDGDPARSQIVVKKPGSLVGHSFFVNGQPVCGNFAAHCYGVSDKSVLSQTRRRKCSTSSLRRHTLTERQLSVCSWLFAEADMHEKYIILLFNLCSN